MRDTIDMAREAGLIVNSPYLMPHDNVLQGIKAFEALVRADEREACAKVCEELLMWNEDDPGSSAAKAIRARGNT
jgi:ABC-type proline/glycine betaine transport system ATPase subunit